MWVWVKKLCYINIFTRAFRTGDKICDWEVFSSNFVGSLRMGAIGAVVARCRPLSALVEHDFNDASVMIYFRGNLLHNKRSSGYL